MINYKNLLVQFHKELYNKVGDPRVKVSQEFVPGNSIVEARKHLIREEYKELMYALSHEDLHQVRKELCDLLYVVFGTAAVLGLPVDEDFKLVHENNLLKFKTGYLDKKTGKWIKSSEHPKVKLPSIVKDYEI